MHFVLQESSVFTSGWREATTPILDRFRRKGTPKRGSGIATFSTSGGGDDGSTFCGAGGLSSLMNLSLLAGAGTGLTAANSSPSLARLLEVMKSGLANGEMISAEDDGQSEEMDNGKPKVRPLAHQTDSPELVYLDTQVGFPMKVGLISLKLSNLLETINNLISFHGYYQAYILSRN